MTARSAPDRPRLAEALACVTGMPWQWRSATYDPRDARIEFGLEGIVVTYKEGSRVGCPLAITDVDEVWEALTDRLGLAGWHDDPRRRFVGHLCDWRCDGKTAGLIMRGGACCPRNRPKRVADCVALASDPAGVVTAETIAREAFLRDRVLWHMADSSPLPVDGGLRTFREWEGSALVSKLGYAVVDLTDEHVVLGAPPL